MEHTAFQLGNIVRPGGNAVKGILNVTASNTGMYFKRSFSLPALRFVVRVTGQCEQHRYTISFHKVTATGQGETGYIWDGATTTVSARMEAPPPFQPPVCRRHGECHGGGRRNSHSLALNSMARSGPAVIIPTASWAFIPVLPQVPPLPRP